MVNRYLIRPSDIIIQGICHESLVKRYEFHAIKSKNDSQPEKLIDKVAKPKHSLVFSCVKMLSLQSK